jgi:CheY-like chemotaxis protein
VEEANVAQPSHILIVEDQPSTAEMLTSFFEEQGYRVSAVAWGRDALAFTGDTIPDLIVLDVRLPDMDGYEVCRRLRTHRRTERIPIIFLTERREREDRLRGLQLGAVDYVTKPFDVLELRLRVRNILRRVGMGQLAHPTTGLPAPVMSDVRLRELLKQSDWAIVSLSLVGLKGFSDVYGFVARDDVIRAIALILNHIVRETGGEEAFLGHLDDTSFVIAIEPGRVPHVQQALTARLDDAMTFFYPRSDWEARQTGDEGERPPLDVVVRTLRAPERSFETLDALKHAIEEAQVAA